MPKEDAKNEQERLERAEEYMAAAREHYAALVRLPAKPDHYPLAYYLAGLAVECLFRAYAEVAGAKRDAGHDLRKLAEAARFIALMPEAQQDEVRANFNDVWTRWLNNHRYRSFSSLRSFLVEANLHRIESGFIKGEQKRVVEYNWTILFQAASALLDIGIARWKISKQKLKL